MPKPPERRRPLDGASGAQVCATPSIVIEHVFAAASIVRSDASVLRRTTSALVLIMVAPLSFTAVSSHLPSWLT